MSTFQRTAQVLDKLASRLALDWRIVFDISHGGMDHFRSFARAVDAKLERAAG